MQEAGGDLFAEVGPGGRRPWSVWAVVWGRVGISSWEVEVDAVGDGAWTRPETVNKEVRVPARRRRPGGCGRGSTSAA